MSLTDLSTEASVTCHLADEQKERLSVLLEKYLSGLEVGLPPTVEELTEDEPELLGALLHCVSGLENLHRMAASRHGIRPGNEDETEDGNPGSTPSEYRGKNRRLGDFELHEEIGRGGMGVVYRATQVSLKRNVAIKLLPLAAGLDARQITRFRHEAEAAGSLQHPHIVPVIAVGCERSVHYYAMQLIDGRSVDEIIASSQAEPNWRTSVTRAIQAAEGLHAAHEFGVIHRDVKPSNLIVDHGGKTWITDFGLARVQSDVSLTKPGEVVGTMKYMSPEQARGDSAMVDGRSDVYSLGATLYEMLTLKPAHDGENAPAILRMIGEEVVTPLRRLRPDLPRDLEMVIVRAMAKSRDERYDTAKDFADDLRRVFAGEATVVRPPTLADRVVRFATKHRRSFAVSLIMGLIVLIGVVVFAAMLAAEKRLSDANAEQAIANGARASRNELIARESIDRLGTQMAELLSDVPAAAPIRRRLLSETLAYYERFAAEADHNPDLRRDLAITYGKIGAFQSELGSREESVAALKRSEQLYCELATEASGDANTQLQWSISQNNLAEKLASEGRFEQAAEWFGKAIATQQPLQRKSEPTALAATTELATTLNNLGLLLADAENTDGAATVYRRAITLLETSDWEPHLLASIRSNLAGLLAEDAPVQAAEYARQALAQQTAALQEDRGDATVATQVILSLNTLGTAQSQLSQHFQAIESFEQAIKISQQLQTRWPDSPTYQRDHVISLNHLGLSLSAVQHLSQAKSSFEEALSYQRALVKLFADDAEVHSMLGGVLNNLGFLQRQLGDRIAAKQSFVTAIEHQSRAVQLAPEVPRYQAYLDKHQHNLKELGGRS